jgi:3-hydroxyacyl-[acyl-carrier-protein] dehydratase
MEDFDAPDAVRADFDTLRATGIAPGRFAGVPPARLEPIEHLAGKRIRATLHVPGQHDVAYFADHFPRRPVFPGTLLIDALAGLAAQLASEALPAYPPSALMPTRISNVKIRSFTVPGTTLELEIELLALDGEHAKLKLGARNDGKTVATGRIEIGPNARKTA